jgi:hypothetical protein
MNPKERVQSIAIVTITAIALAARLQSSPSQVEISADPAVITKERTAEPPISSGAFPSLPNARAQTFVNASGPTVEAKGTPIPQSLVDDDLADAQPTLFYWEAPSISTPDPDVYIEIAADSNLPWDLSDQQVIDQMLSILNDDQRLTFRQMWSGMDAEQRRDWLDQLRVSMS